MLNHQDVDLGKHDSTALNTDQLIRELNVERIGPELKPTTITYRAESFSMQVRTFDKDTGNILKKISSNSMNLIVKYATWLIWGNSVQYHPAICVYHGLYPIRSRSLEPNVLDRSVAIGSLIRFASCSKHAAAQGMDHLGSTQNGVRKHHFPIEFIGSVSRF
jgi:hypothetical protein